MKKRPIYLFAFANDNRQSLQLKEEEKIIRALFDPLHDQNKIEVHYLSSATVDEVYQAFNRFHNRIFLFHYSGHSGKDFLELEDKKARSAFLSILMGQQDALKLVLLNGCSNKKQVVELHEKGVKSIIATSAAIADEKALQFSEFFYQAFVKGVSIDDSFSAAKAKLNNDYPTINLQKRDIVFSFDLDENEAFPWGLYSGENADLVYTIPEAEAVVENPNFLLPVTLNYPDVNKELVELTFEGMSHYGDDYNMLWQLYQKNKGLQLFNTLQNMMLDSFPTSLGIQLRDLFTPEGRTQGRLRLREINDTYLTLIKLVASISMANLWDTILNKDTFKIKEDFEIRDIYRQDLEKYFALSPDEAQFDYVWIIATISRIFADNQIKPFMEELSNLQQSLLEFDDVYDAYRFMEQELRPRLINKDIDVSEVEELCYKGEHYLGLLLKRCAFLCTYQLITVKNIGVNKSRRTKDPVFVHYKSILRGRDYVTVEDKPVKRSSFTSNNSVIVTKDIEHTDEPLNLSPFMIDENAFKIQEDKLPKIHYFNGWENGKSIIYEHAEMMEEDFKVDADYNNKRYKGLEILLSQFDQFRMDFNFNTL